MSVVEIRGMSMVMLYLIMLVEMGVEPTVGNFFLRMGMM